MSSRSGRSRVVARTSLLVIAVMAALPSGLMAQAGAQEPQRTATITANAGAAGKRMSPNLYGIFFEDINHAADGGLYAELVQNRSFEYSPIDKSDYTSTTAWSLDGRGGATGTMAAATADPLNANNLNYLRVAATARGTARGAGVAIRNSGFDPGIVVKRGERYDYSFWARRSGGKDLRVRVAVEDATGTKAYATARQTISSGRWRKYRGVLRATGGTRAGTLALVVQGAGAGTTVDLDMVSLFPRRTFKGRSNGLRKDLARKIAALKPSFMRFPGGCIVNANRLDSGDWGEFPASRARVYRWKETIGPVEKRPTNRNLWGYNQSYGLGYLEYFQFAEDLGATPLPVIPMGTNACFGQATAPSIEPYIQDALDLIEFANGSTRTRWGAKRAALGHPKPFKLKYLGLGNEEQLPQWNANYPEFAARIHARYPEIKLVSNSGPFSDGEIFERNWATSRTYDADLVDEHYYKAPEWFLANSRRYDGYDRRGPHVFVGEYAVAQPPGGGEWDRTFYAALAEAAYTTGLERNSDVVDLAAYAPLLRNETLPVGFLKWDPNLIYFDNTRVFGSPSYQVQKLFSTNRGDRVLRSRLDAGPEAQPPSGVEPLYQVVTRDSSTGDVLVKVVNARTSAVRTRVKLRSARLARTGKVTTMTANAPTDKNTFENPRNVVPITRKASRLGNRFTYTFPASSITFIRLRTR